MLVDARLINLIAWLVFTHVGFFLFGYMLGLRRDSGVRLNASTPERFKVDQGARGQPPPVVTVERTYPWPIEED